LGESRSSLSLHLVLLLPFTRHPVLSRTHSDSTTSTATQSTRNHVSSSCHPPTIPTRQNHVHHDRRAFPPLDDRTALTPAQSNDILSWASKDGEFRRKPSVFRSSIDSAPGALHPPEKGRYQLYVSLACPWAHRTLIVRQLKGLEDFIDVSVVHPHMGKHGWSFGAPVRGPEGEYIDTEKPDQVGEDDGMKGVVQDPLFQAKFIREFYFRVEEGYTGRYVSYVRSQEVRSANKGHSGSRYRCFGTRS
jgi:hypothetical protein